MRLVIWTAPNIHENNFLLPLNAFQGGFCNHIKTKSIGSELARLIIATCVQDASYKETLCLCEDTVDNSRRGSKI
jgi:hypothetical protein